MNCSPFSLPLLFALESTPPNNFYPNLVGADEIHTSADEICPQCRRKLREVQTKIESDSNSRFLQLAQKYLQPGLFSISRSDIIRIFPIVTALHKRVRCRGSGIIIRWFIRKVVIQELLVLTLRSGGSKLERESSTQKGKRSCRRPNESLGRNSS
jgi:hypothetical protein